MAATPAVADALLLPGSVLERTGPAMAQYRLDAPATGMASVTMEWTDSYGRLVERRVVRRRLRNEASISFSIDMRRAVAMRNEIRARCSFDGADTAGRPDHRDGEASASFIARPPDDHWRDYQVIIWQDQTPARLAGLARLGVSAGRIFGTRGALDPAAAQQGVAGFLDLNLRWYVENIATDFYAAYHRWRPDHPVSWLFDEAKRLYRQDPSSRAAFMRTPSLSDPEWLRRIAARLNQHVRAYQPFRPLYYNLADEAGIADLAAAWDFDFSPSSLAGLRAWLKQRYGALDALNREWGTAFAGWGDVMPMTTDEALKRSDGNFAAWADFKAWMDEAFSRAVRAGTEAIHAADPQARSALEGTQIPGWGGYDYSRLAPAVDVMEIYDAGNSRAIAQSLNPHLIMLSTSSLAGPKDVQEVWRALLRGGRGLILWDEKNAFVGDDGAETPRGQVLGAVASELRSGLAAQLIAARPLESPAAILYSPASYRTQWLLDRKAAGGSWTERSAETEYIDDNAVRAATRRAVRLLNHLGVAPRWATRTMVERGELRQGAIRLLVLPHTIALSPREAGQIRDFIGRGGAVVTDAEPGLFDAHSRRLERPLLARVARPRRSSAIAAALQRDAEPGDPRPLTAMATMLSASGIRPPVTLSMPDGSPATDIEIYARRTGDVTILGLQRDQPATARLPPEHVVLGLRKTLYAYDLRHSGAPVHTAHLPLAMDEDGPAVLALSPTPLPQLALAGPREARAGDVLEYRIALSGKIAGVDPVVHVEAIAPNGVIGYYSGNLIVHKGTASWHLPLASNDLAGRWTIRMTNVLSGQIVARNLSVAAASRVR